MTKVKATIFALLSCTALSFSVQAQSEILGVWLTEDKGAKVEFYKTKDMYHSKIVWLKEPNDSNGKPLLDTENPDTKLRRKPIVGSQFATNFVYEEKSKWTNGTIYDAVSGKTYKGSFEMLNSNTLLLKVKYGHESHREKWTRVK
jgi:uncharacterized protein (DUF2147 family)